MQVVVLGAGVVGTASAWYLARAGHDVTVIDRQDGAGLETSFANGGQIATAHAEPWAGPGTPLKALKWMGKQDSPLLFRLRYDPALWAWSRKFLANCTSRKFEINMERTLRVALYSRDCLGQLREDTGIQYEQKTEGVLHYYRNAKGFEEALKSNENMARFGLKRQVLTARQMVEMEPALDRISGDIAGGFMSEKDESGDAFKFTTELARMAADIGVKFMYATSIVKIAAAGSRIDHVLTDKGEVRANAYVMALGSYSPLLLKPLGMHVPVYPAKGYSATVPVNGRNGTPTVSLTDDELKLVFSRLGKDRFRIAGTAEFNGYNTDLDEYRARVVLNHAMAAFPDCGDAEQAELWTGLRPKTPDSVPLIGQAGYDNLYLNTGHGTLGWTMACGSGRVIADLVSSRAPEIDMKGLGLDRFG